MIAAPTISTVIVWPSPHTTPMRAADTRRRSRLRIVVIGDHVIGIGRVAHSEQQSEERNRERRGVGRNHPVAP